MSDDPKPSNPKGNIGRSRSPAKVAAARANGAKGGRPPRALPDEVIAEIGDVPKTTAELRAWLPRAGAVIWRLEATGVIGGEYAERLRAGLTTIQRLMPRDEPRAVGAGHQGDEDHDDEELAAHDADPAIAVS